MKICVINNLYKPYARGGAEIITAEIVNGLEKAGHEIFIITTKPHFSSRIDNSQKIYYLSSCFYNLGKIPGVVRIFWHFYDMFDIISALKIYQIMRKERPNTVITNNLKGISFLIPYILEKLNIKHIHILHDIQLLYPSGLLIFNKEKSLENPWARLYQIINQRLFNTRLTIISPSQWLLSVHVQSGLFKKNQAHIINNPARTEWPAEYFNHAHNSKQYFLYAGQIEAHKGVDLLLEAFTACQIDLPDNFELLIIGGGSHLKYYKQKYRNKKVLFLGRLTQEETVKHMIKSYCLIIPSICYENSPAVVCEALSVGLPVIASDIGGLGELLNKTAGFLVKPASIGDLSDKILWSATHPRELHSAGILGKERVERFSDLKFIIEINKLLV